MLEFISQNWGTIVVCAALLAIVSLITIRLIRNRRQGKTSCGCGCGDCPSAQICHSPSQTS